MRFYLFFINKYRLRDSRKYKFKGENEDLSKMKIDNHKTGITTFVNQR